MRGQHFFALQVACHRCTRAFAAGERGDLREPRQVGFLQHQADVRMGDQRARGIHHVGEPRLADLDARDDLPHELEIDLGDGDAAAGAPGGAGHRHVGLGLLAEVDRAVPGPAPLGFEEPRVAGVIGSAADDVHREARNAQLFAAGGVDPRHLGDRRRLAQQLQVLVAALLGRIGPGPDLRQRGPAELVLDVLDVLLDARRGGERLLALQGHQVFLVLPVGEKQAQAAAHDQRRAHQRDDERRVLGEKAPARNHSITLSARTRIDCGIVMPSAFAVFMLTTSSNFVGCSIGISAGLAPLKILSTK